MQGFLLQTISWKDELMIDFNAQREEKGLYQGRVAVMVFRLYEYSWIIVQIYQASWQPTKRPVSSYLGDPCVTSDRSSGKVPFGRYYPPTCSHSCNPELTAMALYFVSILCAGLQGSLAG